MLKKCFQRFKNQEQPQSLSKKRTLQNHHYSSFANVNMFKQI